MQVKINGEKRELPTRLSLEELVQFLNLKPEQVAIELNRVVVRRREWSSTILKGDDRIEIVHFVGGGESGAGGSRQGAGAGHFPFSIFHLVAFRMWLV